MAGITKQMAIPYFVQFPTKYFAIFLHFFITFLGIVLFIDVRGEKQYKTSHT